MKASFKNYHAENPQVYVQFKRIAFQLINRGYVRLGAKQIFEVIRYHTMIETNDKYRVNNNYTSDYARLFENDHPIYAGYFLKRLCKSV
jgi:hypothetical protein